MRRKMILVGLTATLFLLGMTMSFAQNPPAKPEPRGMGERLAVFLELTPEQQGKFDEIRKARHDEAAAFHEEMAKLRPQFREALKDPKADEAKIDGLIDEMAKVRAAHLKSAIRSFKEMEKVLTPEQLEKFRSARSWMRRGRGFGRGFGPHRWMSPGWGPGRFRDFGWGFDDWF